MSTQNWPAYVLCAAIGATFVKVMDRFDDTVTAKRVIVTAEDGSTAVLMDGTGIQVLAEDPTSYVQIKAKDKPQLNVIRSGATVVTLGENHIGTDGMTLFHGGGKIAGAFTVNDSRAVLGIQSPASDSDTPATFEDSLKSAFGSVYLYARPDGAGVSVRQGDKTKDFTSER